MFQDHGKEKDTYDKSKREAVENSEIYNDEKKAWRILRLKKTH